MQLTSFTYTKENGEVSQRTILPIAQARTNVLAIDVSELEPLDRVEFAKELADINEDRDAKVAELLKHWDINHSFRNFKPERMTDIVVDE